MRILVINSGSSSIKYELFDMDGPVSLATGLVERIGEPQSRLEHRIRTDAAAIDETVRERPIADHSEGLREIAIFLSESGLVKEPRGLDGIGHRVVHGGEKFQEPTLLDDEVVAKIREQSPLAPLHNPANLLGIETTRQHWPRVPQVAVFDTAFHQTIPPYAHLYAIPYEYYSRHGIRRYGFHGTSHGFVAKAAARHLGQPLNSLKIITVHLGNGAGAAAVRHGQCVDTSMGLTPLEGLMMGTRSGDLDPAILPFLAQRENLTLEEIDEILNKHSGLKGICGINDMRTVLEQAQQNDRQAELALEMYAYRVKKYLGAYMAVLGGADAVVLTAGIGENAPRVRELACAGLSALGITIDSQKNTRTAAGIREIQSADSQIRVLVVPTDEEREIAAQTAECILANSEAD